MTNMYILAYTEVMVARTLKDPSHFFPTRARARARAAHAHTHTHTTTTTTTTRARARVCVYMWGGGVGVYTDTYAHTYIVWHGVSVVERPYSILCIFNIVTT